MKKGDNMKKQGFTIIEVILVLAIAGLIFLMMMIALPALQRQQRDTARKEDIDRFIASVKKYQTNNRGALPTSVNDPNDPTSWYAFFKKYLSDGFEDPSSGDTYDWKVYSCGDTGSADSKCDNQEAMSAIEKATTQSFEDNDFGFYIIKGSKCSGDETTGVVKSSNPRKFSVLYKLEGGGLYCQDA